MASDGIRVGLIGAGKNTRDRHIPGFQQVDGVEITAVANRSRESGRVVADQFNIPTVYDNWQDLLEDPGIDAVCIGTWPYMHRTLTLAALEAGKHVLCEKPMALSLAACQRMIDACEEAEIAPEIAVTVEIRQFAVDHSGDRQPTLVFLREDQERLVNLILLRTIAHGLRVPLRLGQCR